MAHKITNRILSWILTGII